MDLKSNAFPKMTIFVMSIMGLVSFVFPTISSAKAFDPIKRELKQIPQIKDYKLPVTKEIEPDYALSATVEISRGTGLYDFQDGTRSDGLDVLLNPALKTPIGSFSLKETYSKNLRDDYDIKAGFSDAAVTYGFGKTDWDWSAPYVLTMSPSITVIIPISEISVKKNQLQTALAGGLSFGIRPDELGAKHNGAWDVSIAVTAGRSFHTYEEDINGGVLNKYSSNQSVSIGYAISDFSFSLNYTNRSRWTYQGNIKQSFVLAQEISYSINDHFKIAAGLTNDAGSILKANGFESNVQIIDENNSAVYLTLGSQF